MRTRRQPSFLAVTSTVTLLLTLAVFTAAGAAKPACCQGQGLFEVPKRIDTDSKPPEGCKRAYDRAMELLPLVEAEIEDPLKAAMRDAVAKKDKDETLGEAWDSAATVALLNVHAPAALWAELNAIKAEWNSDFVVQAGVYLAMMEKSDDAKLLLHCAYDDGNRSPFLMEALATVYHKVGDKPNAVRHINEALAAAPDDPLIKIAKHYFNSGQMPPRPQAQDPVDAAYNELKAHMGRFVAINKRAEELRAKVEQAYFGEAVDDPQLVVRQLQESYDQGLASLDDSKRIAKLTPAQFQREFPGNPASLQQTFKNSYFYSVIVLYLSVSSNMLQGARPAEVSERYDVGFWSGVIGRPPVQYARMMKALRDFEYEGIIERVPGYYLEDWYGAHFLTFYNYSNRKRREDHAACGRAHYNDPAAEKACRLEVDVKYCATVRQLHKDWMDGTESHTQMFGRRFDRAASYELAAAGEVAADAFAFASKYAKQIKVAPNDEQGQQTLREINDKYREIVADAVGDGTSGPAERMRYQEQGYQLYKQRAEISIAQYKESIEKECQEVDARQLEALLEEHRKAVRDMLLEKLIRDLNVSWDPNANCSFSMGKWISVKIDIDGNVDVKGKWSPYKKAFDGSPSVDVTDNFKFDIKDARYVTVSAGADYSKNYGPFTGKAGINAGVKYDSQTGEVSYPVKVEGKLGVGYKAKYRGQDFGVTCFPGELKANFDARVVAKDVMDYWNAL